VGDPEHLSEHPEASSHPTLSQTPTHSPALKEVPSTDPGSGSGTEDKGFEGIEKTSTKNIGGEDGQQIRRASF